MNTIPVSVLVLTRNEEQDLPGCLESITWSDDIHLFDSRSTDRTHEIARSFNCTITERTFDNWSAHQNWGLQNLPFKYPWVFYIDADERVSPELARQIALAVDTPGDAVAFRVVRRDFFLGTHLRYVQTSSKYIRLFKPQNIRYERLVNPVTKVDGHVGDIEVGHDQAYLDHYPFSKGIDFWFERHNKYSRLEADQIVSDRNNGTRFNLLSVLFEKDFNKRRWHQKELFYRLPFRPAIKFFILYILKRGFLDGKAGWLYAYLQATYERMIVAKQLEMQHQKDRR
jgi:Glycosyltransferases involved in cell wall biogenesis